MKGYRGVFHTFATPMVYGLFILLTSFPMMTVRLDGDAILYYALIEAWQANRLHSFAPVEYLDSLEPSRMIFKIVPWRWHPVVPYPPGLALASIPGVLIGDTLFREVSIAGFLHWPYPTGRVLGILVEHFLLTWLAMLCLQRIIREWTGVSPVLAFLAIAATYLGTPWWYYAARSVLYSHAMEVALLVFGLYGLYVASHPGWYKAYAGGVISGLTWSLAVTTRYSAVFWLLPIGILGIFYLYRKSPGDPWQWISGMLVAGFPIFWFLMIFHARFYLSPLDTGYASILFTWNYPWQQALKMTAFRFWALGLHPVRGLFLWHPVFLAALWGLKYRKGFHRAWPALTLIGPWIFLSFYTDWWAGVSCGQRLLLEAAPGTAMGLALFLAHKPRFGRSFMAFAVCWNLILSLGFIAGAWRGYNDGRLGERYPFYHVFKRVLGHPVKTLRVLLNETWHSPSHPHSLQGFHLNKAADNSTVNIRNTSSHAFLSFASRNAVPKTASVVIRLFSGSQARFPTKWWITAVTRPIPLLPGLHYWNLRVGYPSPFLVLSLDDNPVEFVRHHENMGQMLALTKTPTVHTEFYLIDAVARDYVTIEANIPWSGDLLKTLECHTWNYSYFVGRTHPWTPPGPGRILVWALPDGTPPWYQGTLLVHGGEKISLPSRPLQIARQAYVGRIRACYDPAASL